MQIIECVVTMIRVQSHELIGNDMIPVAAAVPNFAELHFVGYDGDR